MKVWNWHFFPLKTRWKGSIFCEVKRFFFIIFFFFCTMKWDSLYSSYFILVREGGQRGIHFCVGRWVMTFYISTIRLKICVFHFLLILSILFYIWNNQWCWDFISYFFFACIMNEYWLKWFELDYIMNWLFGDEDVYWNYICFF